MVVLELLLVVVVGGGGGGEGVAGVDYLAQMKSVSNLGPL